MLEDQLVSDVQMRGGRSHRANSLPGEEVDDEEEEVEKVEKEDIKVVGVPRGLSRFKSRSLYKINELSQGGSAHIKTNFMNLK